MPGVVLLVDAANVVGSRPDGWWRDRAGAARRLLARLPALRGAALPAAVGHVPDVVVPDVVQDVVVPDVVQDVVVVLEGAARPAAPEGRHAGLDVRHAPGSGDDTLVALCAPGTVLVTADRGLAARARERGAQVVGPRWLLDQLDGRG